MNILLVDDALMTRRIINKILSEAGHISITASSGYEALKLLNDYKEIEAILSDWNMPKMNGLELLKKVRKSKNHKNIPFFMISANANKKNFKLADNFGATGYITKPFTPDDITNIFKQFHKNI